MNLKQSLKILELDNIGSHSEAKRAYKDLVRVWHPDQFQNNPRLKQKADQKLREINLAYKFLRNYLDVNHTGELSISNATSAQPPSGIDAANYAEQSVDHGPAINSQQFAGHHNPDVNRIPDPVSNSRPRTSSSGRYVLLAFMAVFVAISALVIYFLYNSDEVASKTRGLASEALEKIADKLEQNDAIPKNDPSVKKLFLEPGRSIRPSEPGNKFEIHLDSGSIIVTELWWEESSMIMYKVDGGSMGIERSQVKKIVKR